MLAWWATYPAERVKGYMVSPYLIFQNRKTPREANVAMDWTSDDTAKVFPPELGDELAGMMYQASPVNSRFPFV